MHFMTINRTQIALLIGISSVMLFTFSSIMDAHGQTVAAQSNAANPVSPANQKKVSAAEQVSFSKQDLARRLGITVDAVEVSGATPVTWRSGALGCPKPGMNYTQALVPGIWLLLKANGKIYRYHAVPNGQPFYCPDDLAEPPVTGSGAT